MPLILIQENLADSPRGWGDAKRAAKGAAMGARTTVTMGGGTAPKGRAEIASQEQGGERGSPPGDRALSRICSCPFPRGKATGSSLAKKEGHGAAAAAGA